MGVKDVLVHLWVLSAAVQIRQASTVMSVSPNVTATCGQSVTLHCNISSEQEEVTVSQMFWIKNATPLCKVDKDHLTYNASHVKCQYADKKLSVTFLQPSPKQERFLDEYTCKLRSLQGTTSEKTWVELKECIQRVDPNDAGAGGPRCSFTGVRGDGEVHWYQEDTRLMEDDAVFKKEESLDKECCLTIIGSLQPKKDHTGPYTCSLWNSQSQNYTANHTIQHSSRLTNSTAGSRMLHASWSIGNCLIISVLLML